MVRASEFRQHLRVSITAQLQQQRRERQPHGHEDRQRGEPVALPTERDARGRRFAQLALGVVVEAVLTQTVGTIKGNGGKSFSQRWTQPSEPRKWPQSTCRSWVDCIVCGLLLSGWALGMERQGGDWAGTGGRGSDRAGLGDRAATGRRQGGDRTATGWRQSGDRAGMQGWWHGHGRSAGDMQQRGGDISMR